MKQNIYNSPAQLSHSARLHETKFSMTNAGLIVENSVNKNFFFLLALQPPLGLYFTAL
jgi:hypothetical protein